MKLKNQLIKAIENYVKSVMLPATYSAMLAVCDSVHDGELPPDEEEWNSIVLDWMKAKEEKK